MSCCGGPNAETLASKGDEISDRILDEELRHAGKQLVDGTVQYVFSAPDVKCGACISTIERAIGKLEGVLSCRVNLTLRRVTVILDNGTLSPIFISKELSALGYDATPLDIGDLSEEVDAREGSNLLRALAVAGFAASNVMLLSVSVWSGAEGATRDLFHLISALIAIPAVMYSGQVFFKSAYKSLSHGRLNMDVPISLAVILALAMSVFETMNGGEEAYFDAAITLLFFLLIGRYLDNRMRNRARNAVISLSRIAAKGASLILPNGEVSYIPVDEIKPGMMLRIMPGERIPVNGRITRGETHLDRSLVTGENAPVFAGQDDKVEAGTLNLTGSFTLEAVTTAQGSFLAEVMEMLQAAEKGRGSYVRIADKMAQIYAPAVHALAALAFIGWMIVSGGDWHLSLYIAISVLIVTCPCALGLAVPVVHVLGAARLFEEGILVKDGAALERLAEANLAVFDKTGTLTSGTPQINAADELSPIAARIAKTLANNSIHPASKAVAQYLASGLEKSVSNIREIPGYGVEGTYKNKSVRLGRPDWVAEIAQGAALDKGFGIAFAIEGEKQVGFSLDEVLRADGVETIAWLKKNKFAPQILSGDNAVSVEKIADQLAVNNWLYGQTPSDKIAHIHNLQAGDAKVMMVGDGLNDAPSLAAAHVSLAPASASDVGRSAADFVFTRNSLLAVPFAKGLADKARVLVKQNFGLAILYNCIAVPLALTGFVTPLFAAIAMSASSIVVVGNSLRLSRFRQKELAFTGAINNDQKSALQNQPIASTQLTGSKA